MTRALTVSSELDLIVERAQMKAPLTPDRLTAEAGAFQRGDVEGCSSVEGVAV